MKRMRLVVWNMARAFPPAGVSVDPWSVLDSLQPDIALLQECQPRAEPHTGGNFYYSPTRRGWGTGVWSRWELSDCGPFPSALSNEWDRYRGALDGYIASACVRVMDTLDLHVTSVHAYPATVPNECLEGFDVDAIRLPSALAIWPGDLVWWAFRGSAQASTPAIIGGDWNTARLFDKTYGPRGNSEFFERMVSAGWCEIARQFHAEEVQTYFKAGKGPYQLDHVFAGALLGEAAVRFDVVRSEPVLAVSDHAALLVEFDLTKLATAGSPFLTKT